MSVESREAVIGAAQKRELLAQALKQRARAKLTEGPLSSGQKALWFLFQSAPQSYAYHVSFSARIRSAVDTVALRRACQAVVDRHGALRTTFTNRDGEPVQHIAGHCDVRFETVDCRDMDEAALFSRVRAAYREPFDLQSAPPFKVVLFTRGAEDHVLLLVVHHIIYDAWSLWVNLDEIRQFYAAYNACATEPTLPLPRLTYQQFVERQKQMLDTEEGERLWHYWRDELAGDLSVLSLPTYRSRPPVQTYSGATHKFRIGPELTLKLRKLAQDSAVTPFMLLLASYQVLLHRYSGQNDILVGSPTAGRNDPDVASMAGYFVNPVVMRGRLGGNPSFVDYLKQVKDTVIGALAHQDMPFPLIVERLQPPRDPSYAPLVQALFVYQKQQRSAAAFDWLHWSTNPGSRLSWAGMDIEFYDLPQQEGQFDIELEAMETEDSIPCLLKYNVDLFDVDMIERMSRNLCTLLDSIVSTPDERVLDLNVLSSQEREQIVGSWNATQVDYPQGRWVHQLFEDQAKLTPDAPALAYRDQTLSYRQFNEQVNRLAHCMRNNGVGPGSSVGVCLERSIEMVTALHAVMKCGAAYLPLDPEYPRDRLEYMASNGAIRLLLTDSSLADRYPLTDAHVIELDRERSRIARYPADNPEVPVGADTVAYIIYTSGSTGRPKGVAVPHRGLLNRLQWMQAQYRLDQTDRVLQKTPYSFDVSVWEFFWPFMTGATLVVAPPGDHRETRRLVELIHQHAITTMHFVPSMLRAFLQDEQASSCATLRQVFCSGEALTFDLQQQFFAKSQAELHNLYGPTEASIDVSHWTCRRDSTEPVVPIGFPIANTSLYILDAALRPVPIGVPGELHIGGVQLAQGYVNAPGLTAEKFIRDPFSDAGGRLYKTGDLARYRPDGSIEYLGRLDFQVKIRGFRIELGEIEAVLDQHPQVKGSAVTAKTHDGDKRLVAYIAADESLSITDLRDFLSGSLPDHMVPSAFVRLDELPLSANGKVDRKALPEPEFGRTRTHTFVPARDAIEQGLVAEWEAVLKISPIGVRDNFFEIGGHSLFAVNLMARLEKRFGCKLPIATLFRKPTIEELGEFLREKGAQPAASSLVPIQPKGSQRPIFCAAGGGGSVLYYYPLASCVGPDQPFYGLQAPGLDGQSDPIGSIEELAAHYVREMRRAQANGPYRLAGHCFGGLVAFEMAQQLLRQGESVESLFLIDIPARRVDSGAVMPQDDGGWIVKLAGVIKESTGVELGLTVDGLRDLSAESRLEQLKARMEEAGFLPPGSDVAQVRGLVRVFVTNNTVRYVPRDVHPVPITLFRALEFHQDYDFSPADDAGVGVAQSTLGWKEFASGPVKIHLVPGNHITALSPPHVVELGMKIQEALGVLTESTMA
jgi:amino acid adenylation domain-containing protein